MDFNFTKIFFITVSYLAGAIPFGLITAMLMGKGDIRKMGSGNIGATNVLRSTGKLGGAVTLLLDALKGFFPVLIARLWWGIDFWTLVVAFAAVIGHNFPVYLRFKGGKGVATSFGVIFALWPATGLIALVIWIGSVVIWKYSSLAALISFALLPIVVLLGEKSMLYVIFSIIISSMIYIRHIENIKRLLSGEEKRVGKKKNIATLLLLILILFSGNVYAEVNTFSPDQTNMLPVLIREGYQNIEKGRPEEAYNLGLRAKELAPDYAPAYFLTAKALIKMSKTVPALSEYIDGSRAYFKDFWTLFNLIGMVYTILLITITLTSFTVLSAWLIRILPLFNHTFRETSSKFINRHLRPLFLGIIIILPAIFGIAWFFIFWIICFWLYLNRREKVIAVLMLSFLLFLPIVLRYNTIFLTGHENLTLQGLVAADKGISDPQLLKRLKKQYDNEPDNTYLPLSIAYLLNNDVNKDGNINESLEYYNKLLMSDQKGVKATVLNNIGNIYFKTGNYDKAISYYKGASAESPGSPIPPFNLSQAFREKLMFGEAEEALKTARGINRKDSEKFTATVLKGVTPVIEYPVRNGSLWNIALRTTKDSKILTEEILRGVTRISGDRFPFLGFSILIILTILSYVKPKTPMAYYCHGCNRIVCGLCTGSKVFGGLCRECRSKDEKGDAGTIGMKVVDKRLSVLLPGLWHIYKGEIMLGIVINLLFFTGVSIFFLGNIKDTSYIAYYLHGRFYLSGLLFVLISYLIVFSNLKYIRIRFR